ncbi:MAG: DUF4097 family beta strand repeat-containing protein [Lachnospiraceae bacterium]
MKKIKKVVVIIGAALCVIGIVLFGIGNMLGGRAYVKAANLNVIDGAAMLESKDHDLILDKTKLDSIHAVDITLHSIDLIVRPSEDHNYYFSYTLYDGYDKNPLQYKVKDGIFTLNENERDSSSYNVHVDIGLFSGLMGNKEVWDTTNVVTLYVPTDQLLEMGRIELRDGDANVTGLACTTANIKLLSGNLELQDCVLGDGSIELRDGDINAAELLIQGNLSVKMKSGNTTLQMNQKCIDNLNMVLDTKDGEIYADPIFAGKAKKTEDCITHFERTKNEQGARMSVRTYDGDISIK